MAEITPAGEIARASEKKDRETLCPHFSCRSTNDDDGGNLNRDEASLTVLYYCGKEKKIELHITLRVSAQNKGLFRFLLIDATTKVAKKPGKDHEAARLIIRLRRGDQVNNFEGMSHILSTWSEQSTPFKLTSESAFALKMVATSRWIHRMHESFPLIMTLVGMAAACNIAISWFREKQIIVRKSERYFARHANVKKASKGQPRITRNTSRDETSNI